MIDLYAVALSALCLVHCLGLPMLVALTPLAGQLSESILVHRVLVLLAAPVSLWVSWKSLLMKDAWPFAMTMLSGLGLLLLAAFVDAVSAFEQPVTIAGALLLGTAHLWRWVRHRQGGQHGDNVSESEAG